MKHTHTHTHTHTNHLLGILKLYCLKRLREAGNRKLHKEESHSSVSMQR